MDIEIKSTTVESLTSRRTGTAYFRQEGWVSLNGEVRRIRIPVESPTTPYAVGKYHLSERTYRVNQWGDLEIGWLRLDPVSRPSVIPNLKQA